jgi:outer membrane scaffolding protein for murein synthesis (MipA/OmpV family)
MKRILPAHPRRTARLFAAWLASAVLVVCWRDVPAVDDRAALPDEPAADAPAAAAPPAAAASEPKAASPRHDIEGAIGPMVSISPEYQGAARWAIKVTPGVFIRWGRFTITNAGGFVTRRDDDVMRGLAADLLRTERWRANLALRIDSGRRSSESAALTGVEDVPRTVRGRLIVSRWFDAGWGATLGTSTDLLGRGGGTLVDFGPTKDIPLPLGEPWRRTRISLGFAVTGADRRYMQSYFGVTAQESAATGYPEYSPGSGLRDVSAGISLRGHYGDHWVGYIGTGASRLLGPARDSPLTKQVWSWGVNAGLAYRFYWGQ